MPSLDYRTAILASLGGQLLALKLIRIDDFDLVSEMAPCTQLQELDMYSCNINTMPDPILNDSPFLPNLKKLIISDCLLLSLDRMFEMAIPSLTELHLNCAHFGLPFASDLNWDVLPRLYPKLQVISIRVPCKSLTLSVVRDIATQLLPSLKLIQLPDKMLKTNEEKHLADLLISELEELEFPICLQFVDLPLKLNIISPHVGFCPFHNSGQL